MNKFLLIFFLLSSSVNASLINKEINLNELSLFNQSELNDFIKKYTLNSYINGQINGNIFSYDNEKYIKLKRKDEKIQTYNIKITNEVKSDINLPTTVENYSIIVDKKYTGYESKGLPSEITNEYDYNEISKHLVIFSKENELNVYLDNIVNLYLMKKVGIDITKSTIIKQSLLSQILVEKKNMIDLNTKFNLNICKGVNIDSDNNLIYIPETTKNEGFSILFDEICSSKTAQIINESIENEDINEPWEDNDDGGKQEEYTSIIDADYVNNSINIAIDDFNRDLYTQKITFDKDIGDYYFRINFNSYNDKFLNIGTYFFEDKKVNYVKKHELSNPYIFIKTLESSITSEFINFTFKDDCAYLLNSKIEIKICNIKDVKEFNNITDFITIDR